MKEENEVIFCRVVEQVWNKGIEKTVDELFAENAVVNYPHCADNSPIFGTDEFKKFIRFIHQVFDDLRITMEQIASDKNKVIALCLIKARRRDTENGSASGFVPIEVSGLCQTIFEGGKISQVWSNIDLFGAKTDPGEKHLSNSGG